MRYIEGINRKSKISFPEYIDEYITEENPVRIIDAFVMSLDMKQLGFKKAVPSDEGRPPFDPKMLLSLYIYGYMNKIISSRKLEAEAKRNIELMWLLRKLTPDYRTIADFRKENKEAIALVFKQFVVLCKEWDLFGMEMVAVDGSKFRACNSKKNNFNEKKLTRKIKHIEEKIKKYMIEIDKNDDNEISSRDPSSQEIKEKIKSLKLRKKNMKIIKVKLKKKELMKYQQQIQTQD